MSAQNKDVKSILLAGIIAAGVFAGAFGSIQLLSASAQTVEPEEEQTVNGPSTVSTSGTASMHVQPDKFTVTVGVQTDGATAQEAASQNADLMDAVIAALEALGVEESQMSTSQYSVYPQYSYKDMVNACRVMEEYPIPPECYVEQEITSYRASSSISVTLDVAGDIEAGQVIDTAVEAGANTVDGAYFFLSSERQQEVQEGLIEEAIASARHRADIAAGAVGMHVSGVQSLSLSDVFFSPYYVRDISTSAIVPGEQPVSMTVQAVYTLGDGEAEGSESDMEIARAFILSKLPGLGIEIEDELDLHTDLIPFVSENELHVDYSVVDTDGDVHDGHIEVVDGEVTVASLDGESIL